MVRPCGDLAHTSHGVFILNPLGKTAAKKYWPFHASAGRTRHKWGPDDSFCRSPVPFARPLELRSAGDRLVLYWRHLLQETRLFDAVVRFAAIRTVRMLRHQLGQNVSFESRDLELSMRHS